MTYLLLIIIYIGFIGLGLPDSLFGAAWPAIYDEFGLHIKVVTSAFLWVNTRCNISDCIGINNSTFACCSNIMLIETSIKQ